MNLDELTIGQLKEISKLVNCETGLKHPYRIGSNYLIRTVTMIYTGKLVSVYKEELVLEQACWIPETERWMQAVAEGKFKEQEPYPKDKQVVLGRGAILDAVEVSYLITEQK